MNDQIELNPETGIPVAPYKAEPISDGIRVTEPYFRDILVYAFRYALTRQAYAPSLFREWMMANHTVLDDIDVRLMVKEINEAKKRGEINSMDLNGWEDFKAALYKRRQIR